MRRALDETDRKLIALLRADGRRPAASLAGSLGVSRGTVQNRIERLRETGVIRGFTVRLGDETEPGAVRAVTLISVEGQRLRGVIRALRGMPEVASVYRTNGRWDVVAMLTTGGLEDFDRALERAREIPGVAATESHLLLPGD